MSSKTSPTEDTRTQDTMCANESQLEHKWHHNLKYLVAGLLFGIALVKSEVVSWFRIQEMFRLESFHMYGVIGSAVAVGALSIFLIKKFKIRTIYGESIVVHPKPFNKGIVLGGLTFGLGWAMTGACPGPLYAQLGTGVTVIIVPVLSAILGTYVYGLLRDRLPH
jgi:uncharacterized membrane protein YedE/YeeE